MSNAADPPLERFAEALRGLTRQPDDDLTALDIAEILWLAQRMNRRIVLPQHQVPLPKTITTDNQQQQSPSLEISDPTTVIDRERETIFSTEEKLSGESGIYSRQSARGPHRQGGIDIRAASAPGLPGALRLARAFRPLMKRVPSRTQFVFDEVATAERMAESKIAVPVMKPSRTRWLSAVLVVDRAGASRIWSRAVVDLKKLLDHHGAFSDIRAWELAINDRQLHLRPFASGANRIVSPRELIEVSGRRIFLVVSDCVSEAWSDGRIAAMLSEWTHRAPVAVLQLLPADMWERCGLRFSTAVRLRPTIPAAPNESLVIERGSRLITVGRNEFVPVAVTTLENERITEWAKFVAAVGGSRMRGYLLRRDPGDDARRRRETDRAEMRQATPGMRISRFDSLASDDALDLARLFAASPYPLMLPIMRLIQQSVMPQSEIATLAEVILGGLFEVHNGKDPDADQWRYEFFDGVRDLLLDAASVSRTLRVIRLVSTFVSQRFGQTLDFGALLLDPKAAGQLQIGDSDIPIARVGVQILERLGGKYAEVAKRLKKRFDGTSSAGAIPKGPRPSRNVYEAWADKNHPQRPRVELAAFLRDRDALSLVTPPFKQHRAFPDFVMQLRHWGLLVLANAAIAAAEVVRAESPADAAAAESILAEARNCLLVPNVQAALALRAISDASKGDGNAVRLAKAAAIAAIIPIVTESPAGLQVQDAVRIVIKLAQRHAGAEALREAIRTALLYDLTQPLSLVPDRLPLLSVVHVMGTGAFEIPPVVEWTAAEVGRLLARSGYRLLIGSWEGVDHVVARGFTAQLEILGAPVVDRITQLVTHGGRPDFAYDAAIERVLGGSSYEQYVRDASVVISIGGSELVQRVLESALERDQIVIPLPWTGDASATTFKKISPSEEPRLWGFMNQRELSSRAELPLLMQRLKSLITLATKTEAREDWWDYNRSVATLVKSTLPEKRRVQDPVADYVSELESDAILPNGESAAQTLEEIAPRWPEWLVYDYLRLHEFSVKSLAPAIETIGAIARRACRSLTLDWCARRIRQMIALPAEDEIRPYADAAQGMFDSDEVYAEWLAAATGLVPEDIEFRSQITRAYAPAVAYLQPQPLSKSEEYASALRRTLAAIPAPRLASLWRLLDSRAAAPRVLGYVLMQQRQFDLTAAELGILLGAEVDHAANDLGETRPLWQLLSALAVQTPRLNASQQRILARAIESTLTRLKNLTALDPGGQCKLAMSNLLQRELHAAMSENHSVAMLAERYESIRAMMLAGGPRTSAMTKVVQAIQYTAREIRFTTEELLGFFATDTEGTRLIALVLAQSRFDPKLIPMLLDGIVRSRSAFEQFYALNAVRMSLQGWPVAELGSLRDVLISHRASGGIPRNDSSRWDLSTQILSSIDDQGTTPPAPMGTAPVIAVFGNARSVSWLEPFCRDLGRRLADAGFSLVIGRSKLSKWFAPEFANAALDERRLTIVTTLEEPLPQTYPHTLVQTPASATVYRDALVSRAAAAIVIGGGLGTQHETEMALDRQIPIIAVAATGGAAARIAQRASDGLSRRGIPRASIGALLSQKDHAHAARGVIEVLGQLFREVRPHASQHDFSRVAEWSNNELLYRARGYYSEAKLRGIEALLAARADASLPIPLRDMGGLDKPPIDAISREVAARVFWKYFKIDMTWLRRLLRSEGKKAIVDQLIAAQTARDISPAALAAAKEILDSSRSPLAIKARMHLESAVAWADPFSRDVRSRH